MKIFRLLAILLAVSVCITGGFTFWLYRELHKPVAHSLSNQYIEIPRGSTPDETVARLSSSGVIGRSWPLRLYIRFSGAGTRLKAGEYRFPSPISPLGVLRKLEEGQQRLARFTVIEGWTRWDIAAAMARIPELKLASAEEALALMDDTSDIRDLDAQATNLEGYLYPDTYSFPPDTTPRQMLAAMVKRFRQVWREQTGGENLPLDKTPRQIVTVASLVETEAKLKDERPLVASVIYNRLKIGMPLGIDSSVIYASKLAGKWRNDGKVYQSDLDRESPYNTRKVRGLPPGPIASSGARSIEAALRPATTDYLYYVREPSRNDGAHNFYKSDTDFQRGVQALRAWERERDAGNIAPAPNTNN
ncbi:MAG TPA: endolytic transglycosylase MltG [Pyrinomonadaceae bacterium]|nr:endolytic transglycosylase MltG [Pyrinomonadaceae bacterium]